jgi:hypothetical protein
MSPTTAIWGDLHEEFTLQRAERGLSNAALWYARQVALSMPMLLSPRPLAILLPLLALDRLWCLVYSLIPMRDGLDRAPGFLAANIAVSAQPPLYVVSALLCVTAASHLATRKRSLS